LHYGGPVSERAKHSGRSTIPLIENPNGHHRPKR
jgi:hypothetical protein